MKSLTFLYILRYIVIGVFVCFQGYLLYRAGYEQHKHEVSKATTYTTDTLDVKIIRIHRNNGSITTIK